MTKAVLTLPETATEAIIQYRIEPVGGRVLIYRTPTDPKPFTLTAPGGEATIPLVEPRTVYYETLPGTTRFQILTAGWKDPRT